MRWFNKLIGIEEQPKNTYRIRAECGNCPQRASYDIKKGVRVTPKVIKKLKCPRCGCY